MTIAPPIVCEGVVVHEPAVDTAPWLVETPDGRYLRVGEDAAELLGAADGSRDLVSLTALLGGRWTSSVVAETVDTFERNGVLRSGNAATEPAVARRLEFRPPFSLQFTVVRPKAWFERHRSLMFRVAGSTATTIMLMLGTLGLLALAFDFVAVQQSLSQPIGFKEAAIVAVGFVVMTSLHEIGHAAALAANGIGPRRIGVMLFYLSPAFFCDVTDAWRLPHPAERVRVALAGVVASFGLAGMTALWAVATGGSTVAWLLAVATFSSCIFNLVPLVKLDGYIALMSHVDLPNLRDRSLAAWRHVCIRAVFGVRSTTSDGPTWLPVFGLAATAFTLGLVAVTVHRLVQAFANLGVAGSIIDLTLGAVVVVGLCRMLFRLLGEAIDAGVSLGRMLVGLGTVSLAVLIAMSLVPIGRQLHAGYSVQPDGAAYLVVGLGDDAAAIPAGTEVTLRRQGGITSTEVGRAVVGTNAADLDVPFQTLSPAIGSERRVPAHGVELLDLDLDAAAQSAGAAVIDRGTVSLLDWIADELFIDPAHELRKALS